MNVDVPCLFMQKGTRTFIPHPFVFRLKLHIHSAVYLDDLTTDVAREVGGEIEGAVGHIFHRSAATQGDLFHPLVAHFFREFLRHSRVDKARCDGVGTDAFRSHLLCNRLGQGYHSRL